MGLLSTLLGHASDLTPEQTREDLDGILLPEESVEVAFKLIRDLFVFTDRRLILVQPEGRLPRSALPRHHLLFNRDGRHAGHGFRAEDLDLWPHGSDPENAQARCKYPRYPDGHRRGSLSTSLPVPNLLRMRGDP